MLLLPAHQHIVKRILKLLQLQPPPICLETVQVLKIYLGRPIITRNRRSCLKSKMHSDCHPIKIIQRQCSVVKIRLVHLVALARLDRLKEIYSVAHRSHRARPHSAQPVVHFQHQPQLHKVTMRLDRLVCSHLVKI